MNPILKVSLAVLLGTTCGAAVGTIVGSGYLTLALKQGVQNFDMLSMWTYPEYMRSAHPDAFKVAYGAVAFAALGFSVASFVWTFQRQRTDYGSAHWQTRSELKRSKMLSDNPGIGYVVGRPINGMLRRVFDKLFRKNQFIMSKDIPHVLMVAPTRAGKGVGFVIPNLLSFLGSVVVLDVKGENFEKTARRRKKIGDDVYRFAPFDWENNTHRYNPLLRIANAKTYDEQYTETSIMADLFLDKANNQNDTFIEAGKTIFIAACLLAIQRGKPNLGEVNKIVSAGSSKNLQYQGYVTEAEEPALKLMWENAASASDKLLTSNIQALKTAGLKQWDNPAVVAATLINDFDFATFRKDTASLYICVSEDHISSLAPLLRLLFADLIATLRLKEPGPDEMYPVMIMIDEFQQMGAMPYLEKAIHTLASYGGRVAMIAQSLASLDKIYGREGRESLENGAGLKLFITPREERSVKEASASVGKTTVEALTTSFGRNKGFFGAQSTTARLEERPLLSETEARFMDPDEIVILAPPQYPIKAQRIKYFEDPYFLGLDKTQEGEDLPYPPVPELTEEQKEEIKVKEAKANKPKEPAPKTFERAKKEKTDSDENVKASQKIVFQRYKDADNCSLGLDIDIASLAIEAPMKDEYLSYLDGSN